MIKDLIKKIINESLNESVGTGHLFDSGARARAVSIKNSRNTREIALEIPIDLFLALAKKVNQVDSQKIDSIKSHIQKGGKLKDIPYLLLDNDDGNADSWYVIGHEGRHRAIFLKSIGYNSMPVVFRSLSEIRETRYIDNPNFAIDLIKNEDGNRSFKFDLSFINGRFVTKINSIKIL